jgi:hypothetical protein
MASKRKKTYQTKGNQYPTLTLTGKSYLLHHYENGDQKLEKGDTLFFLFADTIGRDQDNPRYEEIGGSGYLKAMVYDGREWQMLVMDDLFPGKEHHFGKKERPIDTYHVCQPLIEAAAGTVLQRLYRQHYGVAPEVEA